MFAVCYMGGSASTYIRIRFKIREILSDHRRRDLFALFYISFFYADFIFIIDIVIIYYGTFDTDIRGKAKRTMTSCLHSNFCFLKYYYYLEMRRKNE